MSERLPPSSAAIGIATAVLGIVVGYFIGSAASLGLFSSTPSFSSSRKHKKSWPNSYDVDIHPDSSDEELMKVLRREKAGKAEAETSDDDDDDEKQEEEQDGLMAFEGVEGDCKLVLIVRTDLGMNKGSSSTSPPFPPSAKTFPFRRQNRGSSLPRHLIQLQSSHLTATPSPALAAVGVFRAGENRGAGKIRGGARGVAGQSNQFGLGREGCKGCGENTDSGRECDRAWGRAWAEGGGRRG